MLMPGISHSQRGILLHCDTNKDQRRVIWLCRAVELIAARDLEAGSELTLDYGARPMRDMLRGYGFTPAKAALTDPSEVYEDIGEACEALIVQGSGKVGFSRGHEDASNAEEQQGSSES